MSHRTLFYYDQESNVTCVRDADNGLTYFTYDLLNRMTSVKNPFGEVTYYDYTPDGQVKKRTLGNQTLTYYEYDDVGRVSKVDNRKSDMSVISTFEYEHDKVGNPTKITREDGSATYYEYDKIYQLTGETQVDAQGQVEYAFEYHYDKAHNRTVKVDNGTPTYYAYNEANELTDETTNGQTTYYQYDRCGNTTAKQEPSGTSYYQYDTENLMTRIDFADGSHNYFGYDADSKRVSARTSEGFTEFIYQGPDMLKLLLERDDQGVTQAHYTMGDGLEAMRRDSTSSFYHCNHLGTTHELTDADEAVTDTYRHDAWGVPLHRTGSTINPHTYVGRDRYYCMAEAGLYHAGMREYSADLARFASRDPTNSLLAGYLYALSRPTVLRDPTGLQHLWEGKHCTITHAKMKITIKFYDKKTGKLAKTVTRTAEVHDDSQCKGMCLIICLLPWSVEGECRGGDGFIWCQPPLPWIGKYIPKWVPIWLPPDPTSPYRRDVLVEYEIQAKECIGWYPR